MATTFDLSNIITEQGLEFVRKSLENAYDNEVKQKVKDFEDDLIRKRDEVVSWAVLNIMKEIDVEQMRDKIVLTIKKT